MHIGKSASTVDSKSTAKTENVLQLWGKMPPNYTHIHKNIPRVREREREKDSRIDKPHSCS